MPPDLASNATPPVARNPTPLSEELAQLPDRYGFLHVEDFLAAVRISHAEWARDRGLPSPARSRKPRAKITHSIREQVRELVRNGRTAAEIARLLDISLPTVSNLKRDLGLTRPRPSSLPAAMD